MKNKFNAKKVIIDGITFDSIKESKEYQQLIMQKKAKCESDRVINIELHPRFDIIINGKNQGNLCQWNKENNRC